jgi:hypothetical protein
MTAVTKSKLSSGLYRVLEMPGKNPLKEAHAALDAEVLKAYGFSAKRGLLAQLLDLNLQVARRIKGRKPFTGPGVPRSFPNVAKLISNDCVRAYGRPPASNPSFAA